MNDVIQAQLRLDAIQSWLPRTTEEFDDWYYDVEELIIILKGRVIERYDNKTIDEILRRVIEPT